MFWVFLICFELWSIRVLGVRFVGSLASSKGFEVHTLWMRGNFIVGAR